MVELVNLVKEPIVKTLRSLLLPAALAAAVVLPAGAFAQQASPAPAYMGGEHSHRGGGWMREMRKLNLTDQQRSQIQQLMQQYRSAHPRGSQPDPQARQQLRSQIMNVLTPQQQTQFKADMQRMRSQHPGGDGDAFPRSTPQP